MDRRSKHRGMSLPFAALALFLATGALMLAQASLAPIAAKREQLSERMLAQAREALIAYAAERPITAGVGPGFLPCPDLDDDGWAESTCGSLAGDRGQEERLGRLPWKTLGLPDLRDGHGERLWYAVSTRYKGLLNCAASAACVDLTPATALGTITVRDASGRIMHDGTLTDPPRAGAAAVVIAPGPALTRVSAGGAAGEQRRDCAAGDCDAHGRCVADPPRRAARCDPSNYLDVAPAELSGEDNASFHDRNDAQRLRNSDGFIQGPIVDSRGRLAVNDRLGVVTFDDLMPRATRRVALEVAQCLSFYASRPENRGRLPPAAPACAPSDGTPPFGRVPDTPFDAPHGMLQRWWRTSDGGPASELPTQAQACRIAFPPADTGASRTLPPSTPPQEGQTAGAAEPAWWPSWKPFVLYAPAAGLTAAGCTAATACIELVDAEGRTIAGGKRAAIVVTARAHECTSPRLECDASRCRRVAVGTGRGHRHDAVIALP